jgi:hypothetical protein
MAQAGHGRRVRLPDQQPFDAIGAIGSGGPGMPCKPRRAAADIAPEDEPSQIRIQQRT